MSEHACMNLPAARSQLHPTPSEARSPWPFLATALLLTAALQLPAVLAQRGLIAAPVERLLPLAMLGTFSPLLAALLIGARESGLAGLRAPFRLLRVRGVGAHWYALALLGLTALHLAGVACFALAGGDATGRWLYPPQNAEHVAALLLIPWAEEPGWRGLALPRLRSRYGALPASLILGSVWALWHTLMFLLQDFSGLALALAYANILAGSVLFSWLYERTRGSLWIALLAHAGAHLNNPARAAAADLTPFALYTAAIAVAAVALIACDRQAWSKDAASSQRRARLPSKRRMSGRRERPQHLLHRGP